VLQTLGHGLKGVKVEKKLIGWDLEALEAAVRGVQERSSDSDDEDVAETQNPVIVGRSPHFLQDLCDITLDLTAYVCLVERHELKNYSSCNVCR
jgi:hypothetical protein